jgi:hypothetical protein
MGHKPPDSTSHDDKPKNNISVASVLCSLRFGDGGERRLPQNKSKHDNQPKRPDSQRNDYGIGKNNGGYDGDEANIPDSVEPRSFSPM